MTEFNRTSNVEESKQSGFSITWSNTENNLFYEKISVATLQQLAGKAGLNTGCDIRQLKPIWEKANSILEVGAGYGRVIQALLDQGYQKKLTAVERCNDFYSYLSAQYQYADKIQIIHGDVLHIPISPHSFDVILWLWSGIADFTPNEQQLAFETLAAYLKPNGYLIIDTMPYNVQPLQAKPGGNQIFLTEINNTVIHTYEPEPQEIQNYALKTHLNCLQKITYATETKRNRYLYIICH